MPPFTIKNVTETTAWTKAVVCSQITCEMACVRLQILVQFCFCRIQLFLFKMVFVRFAFLIHMYTLNEFRSKVAPRFFGKDWWRDYEFQHFFLEINTLQDSQVWRNGVEGGLTASQIASFCHARKSCNSVHFLLAQLRAVHTQTVAWNCINFGIIFRETSTRKAETLHDKPDFDNFKQFNWRKSLKGNSGFHSRQGTENCWTGTGPRHLGILQQLLGYLADMFRLWIIAVYVIFEVSTKPRQLPCQKTRFFITLLQKINLHFCVWESIKNCRLLNFRKLHFEMQVRTNYQESITLSPKTKFGDWTNKILHFQNFWTIHICGFFSRSQTSKPWAPWGVWKGEFCLKWERKADRRHVNDRIKPSLQTHNHVSDRLVIEKFNFNWLRTVITSLPLKRAQSSIGAPVVSRVTGPLV